VSGLKTVLSDPSYKVRKASAQVVITLGSRDYLKLEGGQSHIEFIIRQCAIPKDEEERYNKTAKKDAEAVSPKELRSMCDNILSMLTTTIPCMEDVRAPARHANLSARVGPGDSHHCHRGFIRADRSGAVAVPAGDARAGRLHRRARCRVQEPGVPGRQEARSAGRRVHDRL